MTKEIFTGLEGSGKTLALVECGLDALSDPLCDVYANFAIGTHVWGYIDPWSGQFSQHDRLVDPAYRKRFATGYPDARIGQGFVRSRRVEVLRDWEHFCSLRVWRDPLGVGHRKDCDYRKCSGCLKRILILLDEVNSWANSRHWQDVGVGLLTKFTYGRKHGLDLIASAQNEDRVDVGLRHLLQYTWICRPSGLWRKGEGGYPIPVRWGGFPLAWFTRERFQAGQVTDAIRAGTRELESHVGLLGGMELKRVWFSDRVAESYDTGEEVMLPGTKKIANLIWREGVGSVA